MNALVVVHCYQGDQQRVSDFLPMWLQHGFPVLLLSPEDSPVVIDYPNVTCRWAGEAGWDGPHTITRQIAHWKVTAEYPADFYFLNDSDSMCLSEELPRYLFQDPGIFWTNSIGELEPGRFTFPLHGLNFQPPFFLSRDLLERFILAADEPTQDRKAQHEGGRGASFPYPWEDCLRIDGFYTHVVEHTGVRFGVYPDGAMYDLGNRVRDGARLIHQVKTPAELGFLRALHQSHIQVEV